MLKVTRIYDECPIWSFDGEFRYGLSDSELDELKIRRDEIFSDFRAYWPVILDFTRLNRIDSLGVNFFRDINLLNQNYYYVYIVGNIATDIYLALVDGGLGINDGGFLWFTKKKDVLGFFKRKKEYKGYTRK